MRRGPWPLLQGPRRGCVLPVGSEQDDGQVSIGDRRVVDRAVFAHGVAESDEKSVALWGVERGAGSLERGQSLHDAGRSVDRDASLRVSGFEERVGPGFSVWGLLEDRAFRDGA